MRLRTLIAAASLIASASISNVFGVDVKTAQLGDLPAETTMITNGLELVGSLTNAIGAKADKFILGKNLSSETTLYRLEIDDASFRAKFGTGSVIATTTNVNGTVIFFNEQMKRAYDNSYLASNGSSLSFVYVEEGESTQASYTIDRVSTFEGLTLNVDIPEKSFYDYSHPYDWIIRYNIRNDYDTTDESLHTYSVNNIGQVIDNITTRSLKKNIADLYIEYLDEVNLPNFSSIKYEILDGPATLAGNVLTAQSNAVINVRAYANNGEYRDAPVSMFTFYTDVYTWEYNDDKLASRDRVNDYHANFIRNYRSTPNTNRVYYTGDVAHHSNTGDEYTSAYGKHFFPYQHVTVTAAGDPVSYMSHAPISKHVVLAAHHYGGACDLISANKSTFINWDGKFSGSKEIKYVAYYYLGSWASSHGYKGTDTQSTDLGLFVIKTLDENNEGIPDECLPYIATSDWLAQTYGTYETPSNTVVNVSGQGYIPIISLNQSKMVALRLLDSIGFNSWINLAQESEVRFPDGIIKDMFYRSDIYQYARLGGWHEVIGGDSGHPLYLYDPAYTTGLTYDFGEGAGPEPLLRPILLSAYKTRTYGSDIPRYAKILKAFVESIGDTLYVLGNPEEQSTDPAVVKENAKRYTKELIFN